MVLGKKEDYNPDCFRVKHQPSSFWLLHPHKDAGDTRSGKTQRTEQTLYKHTLKLIGAIQEIGVWLLPISMLEYRGYVRKQKGWKTHI